MTLERLKLKLHPHTTCGHRLQSYEAAVLDFLFLHYFPSQLLSSPFLSCPPIRIGVTQVRGHKVGSSPPSPLRYVPCIFIARRLQPFPRRRESKHATPTKKLLLVVGGASKSYVKQGVTYNTVIHLQSAVVSVKKVCMASS